VPATLTAGTYRVVVSVDGSSSPTTAVLTVGSGSISFMTAQTFSGPRH
jgi:hypothetical protein